MGMARRNLRVFSTLTVVVLVADQLAKLLAVYCLTFQGGGAFLAFTASYYSHFWNFPYTRGSSVAVWEPWVKLSFTTNTGMAWGMLHGYPLLLSFVSLVLSIAIWMIWRRYGTRSLYLTIALGLVLGGAIGNMIDRFRLQVVVDFIDVLIPVVNYDFPVFNIADSCASVGTVMIAAYLLARDLRLIRRQSATRYDLTNYYL